MGLGSLYKSPAELGERDSLEQQRATSDEADCQSGEWSWSNGTYKQCRRESVMREQRDPQVDVWIYHDKGWPGTEDKMWKCVYTSGKVRYD